MTYVRYLVTDVQKAVDFYSTHLGFTVKQQFPAMVPGKVWAIKSLTPPISRSDSIKAESGSEALRLGYILFLVLETMSLRA